MYKKLYENEDRKRKRGHRSHNKMKPYDISKKKHDKTEKFYNKLFGSQDIKKKEYVEIDYTLDGSVKQLFLNLTKMQIPFNYEKTLEPLFPDGMEKDEHGNYFIQIGNNDIMFCGHLDTYAREHKRVWHIIENNIITSDGTTTLGGDDKAGITVMIKMIEAGIPGTYYFFRGEEGVTSPTGTWGSKQALKSKKSFFEKFKKCIAFDRKGTTSVITEQMYSECCSEEFTNALVGQFNKLGMNYKADNTGMWCDSGVFMETIPECTNISVGFKSEHTFNEEQNIEHLEKLCEVVLKINWNTLPVKRDPTKVTRSIGRYRYDFDWEWDKYSTRDRYGRGNYYTPKIVYSNTTSSTSNINIEKRRDYASMEDMFYHICDILEEVSYECLNADSFKETEEMYFQNYDTNDFFGLRIIDYEIYMSEDETLKKYINYGNLANFTKQVMYGINPNTTEEEEEEGDDLDRQLDKKLGKNTSTKSAWTFYYSEEQMKKFRKVAENNINLVKNIMNDLTSSERFSVNKRWLEVEDAMIKSDLSLDYTVEGSGINPDNFIEWVGDNWIEMKELIKEKEKKDVGNDIEETIKTLKKDNNTGFLPHLINSDIHDNKYHYDEYIIYSKIVERNPILLKMMLKDFEINNKAQVRDTLKKEVWDNISKMDYKRIDKASLLSYPEKFIKWVYEYSEEISKYLGLK